jgi:hypothetical protein
LGCLGLGLLAVAGLLGGAAWMGALSSRFGEAEELKAQRQELAASSPFTPAADGRVPPERLEAFLRVRARVAGPCERVGGFFAEVEKLEEAERRGEEPGFAEAFGVVTAGLQLPGLLADYFEARNRALVEESMTLEEWRWYTVLAYRAGGGAFRREGTEADRRNVLGSGGDRELARRALVAQLEAARAAGPEAVGADWIAALEAEAQRLDDAQERTWPWDGGLPERVRESLAVHEQRLRELHCTGGEEFELDEIEKDGVSIQVR